jgi:hypothetical protein
LLVALFLSVDFIYSDLTDRSKKAWAANAQSPSPG